MFIQFPRQGAVDPYKGCWQPLFFEEEKLSVSLHSPLSNIYVLMLHLVLIACQR